MSFIEGIGDEVTAFFVILIVIALATLVTFIGNGYSNRLYSTSPIRARPLVILQETQSQQAQQRQTPTATTEPSESNRNSRHPDDQSRTTGENRYQNITSNEAPQTEIPSTESLQSIRNRYDQVWTFTDTNQISSREEGTEDVSEDTEDQNSSDETRPSEAHPENHESETPTAPPEEVCNENSGQSTEPPPSGIRIRLKYLDDTERTVRSNPTVSIAEFKRNHFQEDLANNKIVRLIFCGHLLRDNSTLESYRIVDNSVIHVQILQAQTDQNRSPVSQNTELDLSNFLWPLVSIILGVCWVFYFKYPEFFNLVSIGLLLLFTSGFVFLYSQLRIR
ncbi:hypothetical protein AVEN_261889-1 [Araneus ventricosus]|uniref:Ubiquitin-like domain-containing protein n=1 Tax=Araneus ventricosus TaxID=182803 RepID=A0A4Y2KUM9_ARAVE|nr:hypothetical protein AVEN_261889-1 [Araneus ventricosus]